MNQQQLIDAIANHSNEGLSKVSIRVVLDAQAAVTHKTLAQGVK